MSLILNANLRDEIDSWVIKVNKKVAEKAGFKGNDVVEVFNRDRGSTRFMRLRVDGRMKTEIARMNRETAQLDGGANNDQMEITKVEPIEAKELLVRVEMEAESRDKQIEVMTEINMDQGELIHKFFRRKKPVFNQGSKIYWKEKNLTLKVLKVNPFPYAAYVPGTKVKAALTSPFNGILMVDTSGSMYKQKIPNVPGTLRLTDDPILSRLQENPKYKMLKDVMDSIENDSEVPRVYAALGAVLLYFSEKAERELSEKVALISYSNKARIAGYKYKGESRLWLQVGKGGINNPEQYKEMLVRALFECVGENTKKVTHGYNAFIEAWKLFKFMAGEGRALPTMIVILSDGEFNGDKGSFARLADVQSVSKKVIDLVKRGFGSNKKVVINAVYIGDDQSTRGKIAVNTLKEITQLTNGELIQPKQLVDLAKFYENAAHSLVYDLGTMDKFEEDESDDEDSQEEPEEED